MSVLVLRFTASQDDVTDVETRIDEMMAAIHDAKPAGIRYTLGKLPDGVTFVGVLEIEDGVDNPLPAIAEARRFQQGLEGWSVDGKPAAQRLEILGTFG